MHLITLVMGIALQAPPPAGVPVFSECDASADIVARAPRDAAIEVHYSIAGAPTCYWVTARVQGKLVQGFVLDRHADAVVAFEKSRVETEQNAFKAPLPLPPSAAPAPDPPKTDTTVPVKAQAEKKPLPKPKKMAM